MRRHKRGKEGEKIIAMEQGGEAIRKGDEMRDTNAVEKVYNDKRKRKEKRYR